ncbi:NAD binding domain of 6-phosphogluconate dehydrogenase-domain-containing protein [Dioszegia hungarica]|uniref:NAD binding domain of 6-phosphogluconate dehydrogenase-domain-containing protein n=1 Tax=Dioszegia hungarica TaxID=4972 RepID=A0AA38H048_9TREE|nr:NAD binding domain of 6-phosphogluconate dehydrogenase-domain-containing protein [Dioszegia hungarica]KAI9632222.1 NAD binding domain of 6-phosphogluconate dehydrogenase-domain-containing protein [Dioszegia hungarica]
MSGQQTPPVEKVGGTLHMGNKQRIVDEDAAIPFSRPSTPTPRHDQLALIGLGAMGRRMATNLALDLQKKHMPPLIVSNRSDARIDDFKRWAKERGLSEDGYKVVKDLKEIGQTADMILTSLGSDEAVEEVFTELFAGQEEQSDKGDGIIPGGAGKSTIFVDTSTIFPATAGKLERLAASKPHRTFLSCPVFGVPKAAETADITLAISGDYYAKKHAAHALVPALAKKVMDLGSNVERAMSFKLVGNALELGFIELLSECFTLSDQAGVGSDKLLELIKEQHSSPALVRYADRILHNKFGAEGGFTLGGGIVDAKHIRQLADVHNVPMPTIDVANQHMLSARAHGGEEMDWTALVGGQRIAAGLQPFAGRSKLERYYEDT